MIVGTAGHIDHGKTTLVRALTGIDTDRLPEEKRRGISIELGYAYLPVAGGETLGFIDVPGHERLLHTMLAGATGIDHALLLVAADDGPMPQTREHLAVLALLGIRSGTVAITKADRADPARIETVRGEIGALLAGTPLADASVFEVAAQEGRGVDALREHLMALARGRGQGTVGASGDEARTGGTKAPEEVGPGAGAPSGQWAGRGAFRLAVDRAFTLTGVGTVVTGTVHGGRVRPGDELRLLPADRPVRVRSVHAQNRPAESAHGGQRCALGLAGIDKDDVGRGHWICAPSVALTTQRIDVELQLWRDEAAALRSGTPVHLHLGAADVLASVALLEAETLTPGRTGLAQLVLRAPLAAWHGDRGVLRDASAMRTLAGVRVLDPDAPTRYRRTPERLAVLEARRRSDLAEQVAALLEHAPLGLDRRRLARSCAVADGELPLPADAILIEDAAAPAAIAPAHWAALQQRIAAAIDAFHAAQPDEVGPDVRRLQRLAGPRVEAAIWRQAIAALLASGELARTGAWLHRPAHAARLSDAEEKLAQKLLPPLEAGGYEPPWVRDLAREIGVGEALVRMTLASLARRGRVHAVVKDLYYPASTLARLAAIARRLGDDAEPSAAGLAAASFRDATGLGRKRAIQLLEFFDRVGYTRRIGDTHRLRSDGPLFEAPSGAPAAAAGGT